MNDYYDVSLKESRLNELRELSSNNQFIFYKESIADKSFIEKLFADYSFDVVVNLAAQAGVRYSITNPDVYIESNIIGFYNILEACRHSYDEGKQGVQHLVFASSSSVYGNNEKNPYSTDDKVDNPISLYAATKKVMSCWLMLIPSYITFHQLDFDFSQSMALLVVQIWLILDSPTSW